MVNNIDPLSVFDEAVPESHDAADAKVINAARQQAAREAATKKEVIQAIMGQAACRQWLSDVLSMCNIFVTPHMSGDAHDTAFNCGKQYIGNLILADIIADSPDQYITMCRERLERERENMEALKKVAAADK